MALRGRRDRVVLATKFGSARLEARGSRSEVVRSVEASLRALDTDWIDLLQFHFPDPATPIAETLAALDDLVHQGKVRYLGCSNFTGWQLADAAWEARTAHRTPFVSVQNQWSLLHRDIEQEVTGAAAHFGLSVLPYFPLASGLLTGKVGAGDGHPGGQPPRDRPLRLGGHRGQRGRRRAPAGLGRDRGWSPTRVALSWLASHGVVGSVIAGATSPEQVRANAEATVPDLTAAERTEVASLVHP